VDLSSQPPHTAIAPAEIAGRLRLSVTRLARQLRHEAGAGLTPTQLSTLAVIANHGPLTLGAVADHEGLAPPSITKVVTKLEGAGLVVRTADTSDRRVAWVAVSSQGAGLIAESRRRKTTWLTARIRQLDSEQQRRLADALDVLDELTSQEHR
jgi:DNA-binding MarR family transcriptional regulator